MKEVMEIVRQICSTESIGCRSLNKSELARHLMDIIYVPSEAEIQEIPLDWDNQVVVLFLLPGDDNYYSLFAGIGNDGKEHLDLTICGKLVGKMFDFYNDEKELPVDYFKKKEIEL